MKIEEERISELIKACRMVEEITAARLSKTTVAKGYSDIADALQELVNLRNAFEKACKYLSIGSGCYLDQRPHGKWINRRIIAKNRSFDMVVCSNCQTEFSWDAETGVSMDNYNTCPNCGADMRQKEGDEE